MGGWQENNSTKTGASEIMPLDKQISYHPLKDKDKACTAILTQAMKGY